MEMDNRQSAIDNNPYAVGITTAPDAAGSVNLDDLPPKWQERFAFFDAHGAPGTPHFQEALKTLPSWKQRQRIRFNWLSFLFGWIYYLCIGMWQQALTWLFIFLVITFISLIFSDPMVKLFFDAITLGLYATMGLSANYAYYLKRTGKYNGWNPFKRMPLFTT
jgi:hypothetical protein